VGAVVVLGAGMAGLLSAAAVSLAEHPVTVVERDELPDDGTASGAAGAQPRPGVPQGHHLHALLHAGLTAMEQLLPGVRREVVDAGGVPIDTGDLAWLAPQGWSPIGQPAY
jgi:glycine/D-amino acid oxidase-like deaminating enzyme